MAHLQSQASHTDSIRMDNCQETVNSIKIKAKTEAKTNPMHLKKKKKKVYINYIGTVQKYLTGSSNITSLTRDQK